MGHEAGHSLARTSAALIGAPLAAIAAGLALATLPIDPRWAHALGAHAIVPLWVLLACALPLARHGRRAWAIVLAIALPAIAVLAVRA